MCGTIRSGWCGVAPNGRRRRIFAGRSAGRLFAATHAPGGARASRGPRAGAHLSPHRPCTHFWLGKLSYHAHNIWYPEYRQHSRQEFFFTAALFPLSKRKITAACFQRVLKLHQYKLRLKINCSTGINTSQQPLIKQSGM